MQIHDRRLSSLLFSHRGRTLTSVLLNSCFHFFYPSIVGKQPPIIDKGFLNSAAHLLHTTFFS